MRLRIAWLKCKLVAAKSTRQVQDTAGARHGRCKTRQVQDTAVARHGHGGCKTRRVQDKMAFL